MIGSSAAILGLLLIFGFFYRRATSARLVAEGLVAENERVVLRHFAGTYAVCTGCRPAKVPG